MSDLEVLFVKYIRFLRIMEGTAHIDPLALHGFDFSDEEQCKLLDLAERANVDG